MHIYKRTVFSFVKSFLLAIFSGVIAWFIAGFFSENPMIVYGVGIAVLLLFLSMTLFSENIRVEIDDEGIRYFSNGKLSQSVSFYDPNLASYELRTNSKNDTANLTFIMNDNQDIYMDLAPLGTGQVWKVIESLEQKMGTKPQKLETKKKGE